LSKKYGKTISLFNGLYVGKKTGLTNFWTDEREEDGRNGLAKDKKKMQLIDVQAVGRT
jgi:hypothetical protein